MAFQQIDPDRAGAAWRKTLELRPGQSRAHVNLGMTFKRKGQLDEAMDSFRQAVACEPGNAHAHYNLAVMLNQKGLRREAIEAYRMSVKHDPRNGKAWNNLGNALGREGLFEEALEARQRAVEWMPREGTVHYNLGNALVPLARDAEAAVAFAKAVELEPKDAEARCNLGHALRRLGRFRESREAVEAGHRAGSAMPGWRYPSERWVKRARALEAAEGQLDAVRRGEREPEGAAEAGALAEVALWKGLPWTAARLYAAALAEPSERPEHAAFLPLAAGRVACGAGTGESPAPEADERTRWLDQAIGWMEVGLEAEDRLDAEALGRWKHDPGLACLRDAEARARLPEDQRRRVEAVWAAVERRLKTP
jgi:Tfp pilus assembly protein PilF